MKPWYRYSVTFQSPFELFKIIKNGKILFLTFEMKFNGNFQKTNRVSIGYVN